MQNLLKPKVLEDIKISGRSVYRKPTPLLNLGYKKRYELPFAKLIKVFIITFAILGLIFGSVTAPTKPTLAANPTSDEERKNLENQLRDLENQIGQYEGQILSYQKQGKSLKNEVAKLNDKIAKLNLQIKAINLTLVDLDRKIGETQGKIEVTENNIDSNKQVLASLLRNLYQNEQVSLIEVFLKNPKLSDFFNDLNNITLLQGNVRQTIVKITDFRDQLTEEKTQLALARTDAATIKAYQASQKNETDAVRKEKNDLLSITKGQESKYQTLLKQSKETAAQIRSRIFEFLGGGELTFAEAYEYAKLAGGATGVRPALILAVLDRESALGRNVGRCSYKTAMSPSNQKIFLEITQALNISPDSVNISCPNADGIYGGAMGPAQFIPSTWRLYEGAVAKITGRTPANPWNNADAFVAAALYLRDAGAAQNERNAAARYYCGSRWNRYVCTNVYGRKVVEQAERFEEDIRAIIG